MKMKKVAAIAGAITLISSACYAQIYQPYTYRNPNSMWNQNSGTVYNPRSGGLCNSQNGRSILHQPAAPHHLSRPHYNPPSDNRHNNLLAPNMDNRRMYDSLLVD